MNEKAPQPSPTPQPSPRLLPVGLLAVVIIGALLAFGLIPRFKSRAELAAETKTLALPTVAVIKPQTGKGESALQLPSEIKPWQEATILARASGYLKKWYVDIGDTVKAGQLLAEIDTPELDQELAHSRAQVKQAEAELQLAKLTADRWQTLLKTASVSEQEAAEKIAQRDTLAAQLEAARANVRRLEELQSFRRITAPFDGLITARKTEVGQLITAGSSNELFHIAQVDPLRVYVRVPQTASRQVAVGQSADLSIAEMPGQKFTAKVTRTSGAIDLASRTLLTELKLDNKDGKILSGSYATIRFTALNGEKALTVPANTLLFRSEGPQVGVVGNDNKVELRSVTLGRDFGATLEIKHGITTNDRIILNPSDSLSSGAMVRVMDAKASKP